MQEPRLPQETLVEIIKYLKPTLRVMLVSKWFTAQILDYCIESYTFRYADECSPLNVKKFSNARDIIIQPDKFTYNINPISLTLGCSATVSLDYLIGMSRLTSLNSHVTEIIGVSKLTNLRSLRVHGSEPLNGLMLDELKLFAGTPSPINMSSLKYLALNDTKAPELTNIQLDTLILVNTAIPHSYMCSTRSLTFLNASWPCIPCEEFMNLTKLESLTTHSTPGSVIAKLTTLKHLYITRSNITGDHLRGLMLLSLNFQVPDKKIVCAHMTQLHTLMTCGNAVSDNDIKHLTSLTRLVLCGYPSDKSTVTDRGIAALTNLRELQVHNNTHITNHGVSHLKLMQKIIPTGSVLTDACVEGIYRYRYTYDGDRGGRISTSFT